MAIDNGTFPDWDVELRTVETMIYDRGWSHVKVLYQGTDPCLICTCRDNQGELVMVFLSKENKVGVRVLRKLRAESSSAGSTHCILLSLNGLTPFANKELHESDVDNVVELFQKSELCMPIVHHGLVPPHVPLTKAQKSKLLQELGCKASALPKLKESDPVARYLYLRPGTVVKIIRRIGHMESEPYFRLVC